MTYIFVTTQIPDGKHRWQQWFDLACQEQNQYQIQNQWGLQS